MRTDNKTLIKALEILANDIQSVDGVANAVIDEAAQRLGEIEAENAKLKKENELLNECCHLSPEMAKSLTKDINKIKADAIREATASLNQNINTNGTEFDMCYSSELEDYADSIECNCQ